MLTCKLFNYMNILDNLNPAQREAVINTDGPSLVLAGAGSGKTRVLTYKVAYILKEGLAKSWEILAVTFTNKAAGEMRSRIEGLLGEDIGKMWVGTFHAIFARVLRQYGHHLGYNQNFAIYDREDQLKIVKELIKNEPGLGWLDNPQRALWIISSIKSKLRPPENIGGYQNYDPEFLFSAYEKRLKNSNALDFDDLLVKPLNLFQQNPEIAAIYQSRFRYILVDEFQDTNIAQNELLKLLWLKHRNITAVGDDDQAIYGWRGAELKNILQFARDYPGAKIFRLEQNYRSTDSILKAAQAVIDNNRGRHSKTLWTEKVGGNKPVLISADDDREEAAVIAKEILRLVETGRKRDQIAVFYRTNAQSRILEMFLLEEGIPYTIVGGLKFYQRKEIKDLLAYLKLIINPNDNVSFDRVVKFPPRGIGAATIAKLNETASAKNMQVLEAVDALDESSGLRQAAINRLKGFGSLIKRLTEYERQNSFPNLVKYTLTQSGLMEHFMAEGTEEAFSRAENLREFTAAAVDYYKRYPERNLIDFLQEAALVSDTDEWEEGELVSLMTLHSAKGLEFPVVFITGLEDGLFPLIRNDQPDIEEERRLFYVGVTRAEELLYISHTGFRRGGMYNTPSRFLKEIPKELLDTIERLQQRLSRASRKETKHDKIPAFDSAKFKRGDMVNHSKFGDGIVESCEGKGENETVTLFFRGYGMKKLLVKFAKLKLVK